MAKQTNTQHTNTKPASKAGKPSKAAQAAQAQQAAQADEAGSKWAGERARIEAGASAGARFVALGAVLRDMAMAGKQSPTFGEVQAATASYTKNGKPLQREGIASWRTLVQRGKQCGAIDPTIAIGEAGFDLSAYAAEVAPSKPASKARKAA